MIEDIRRLGFDRVELGYDLKAHLVPGVEDMVRSGGITVTSLHNFCPVPVGAPEGHPELWMLASRYPGERKQAVRQTARTLEFAARVGARVVVAHAGRVPMRYRTTALIAMFENGRQYSSRYEKVKMRLLLQREKKAPRYLDSLLMALDELMPVLEATGVRLALENLPTWETLPTEMEMEQIHQRFPSDRIGYWHDIGHGRIRENMGFVNSLHWLNRLRDCLFGMHLHDVAPPAQDHLMPGLGHIPFAAYRPLIRSDIPLVIEPSPGTPDADVRAGLALLQQQWMDPPVAETNGTPT